MMVLTRSALTYTLGQGHSLRTSSEDRSYQCSNETGVAPSSRVLKATSVLSCLCLCPPSLHPKTNPGLCWRGNHRVMQSFTLIWCWQGSSYRKGWVTLHQGIWRQVCYNSTLVIEEKRVAKLEKSYWRDWPLYATVSMTLQFEVSSSNVWSQPWRTHLHQHF